MNHLHANLICEQFPETSRILYGLSKQFQTEPEIAFLASKHGLLQAASALGHIDVVAEFLTESRLTSIDLTKAFVAAYEGEQYATMVMLADDARFDGSILSGMVGCADPFLADFLMDDLQVVPTTRDVFYAAFGLHGGRVVGCEVEHNDLTTLRMVLSHPKLVMNRNFTQICEEIVIANHHDDFWSCFGDRKELHQYFGKEYVCFTDFEDLSYLLMKDPRFVKLHYWYNTWAW